MVDVSGGSVMKHTQLWFQVMNLRVPVPMESVHFHVPCPSVTQMLFHGCQDCADDPTGFMGKRVGTYRR